MIAGYGPLAIQSYIAELRKFGTNQGDHGTSAGREAAVRAGLDAAARDLETGAPQGTSLDRALQKLGIASPYTYAQALAMNQQGYGNAAAWGAQLCFTAGRSSLNR